MSDNNLFRKSLIFCEGKYSSQTKFNPIENKNGISVTLTIRNTIPYGKSSNEGPQRATTIKNDVEKKDENFTLLKMIMVIQFF